MEKKLTWQVRVRYKSCGRCDLTLSFVQQKVCDATITVLDIDGLSCECSGSLAPDSISAIGNIYCDVKEDCIEADLFCGAGTVAGSIEAGEFGISFYTTTCLSLDVGLFPSELDYVDDYDVCIEAGSSPGGWGFDFCNATIRGEFCECTPCGVFGMSFDCSSVNISPAPEFLPIYGPKMDVCSRLNFSPFSDEDDKWKEKSEKGKEDNDDDDWNEKGSKRM
jgi:hypothetical protein